MSVLGRRKHSHSMIVQKRAGQKASFRCSQTLSLTADTMPRGLHPPENSKVEILDKLLLDDQSIRSRAETLGKNLSELGIENIPQERLEDSVKQSLQKRAAGSDECIED